MRSIKYFVFFVLFVFVIAMFTFAFEKLLKKDLCAIKYRLPPPVSERFAELKKLAKEGGMTHSQAMELVSLSNARNNEWDSQPYIHEIFSSRDSDIVNCQDYIKQELRNRNLDEDYISSYIQTLEERLGENLDEMNCNCR